MPLGHFMKGFQEARQKKLSLANDEDIKKLKLKQFKRQLEEEEFQQKAGQKLISLISGKGGFQEDQPFQEGAVPGFQAQPEGLDADPRQLLDVLADPQGQAAALQSGKATIPQLTKISQTKDMFGALGDTGDLNIDPVSRFVAAMTGDVRQLKSGKIVTKDIETPEGPRTKVFTLGGKELSDLGKPKRVLTPEQSAKVQQIKTARAQIPMIEKLMFKTSSGKKVVDDVNVLNMWAMTPGTEGRRLGTLYETGIQAVTRSETGAAMPPEEVENTRKRFQPHPFDDEKTKKIKFQMYREFLSGTLRLISPDGMFLDQEFDTELKKRGGKLSIDTEKIIDFADLP